MDPMSMFQHLDANGDGRVTEEDFINIAEKAGLGFIGKLAIKQAFRRFLDKNKDGTLDLNEAAAAFEHVKHLVYAAKGGHETK